MKKYKVTIELITGYRNGDLENPYLKPVFFEVEASSPKEAIKKASELEDSKYSVWNTFVTEIN